MKIFRFLMVLIFLVALAGCELPSSESKANPEPEEYGIGGETTPNPLSNISMMRVSPAENITVFAGESVEFSLVGGHQISWFFNDVPIEGIPIGEKSISFTFTEVGFPCISVEDRLDGQFMGWFGWRIMVLPAEIEEEVLPAEIEEEVLPAEIEEEVLPAELVIDNHRDKWWLPAIVQTDENDKIIVSSFCTVTDNGGGPYEIHVDPDHFESGSTVCYVRIWVTDPDGNVVVGDSDPENPGTRIERELN